MSGFSSLSGQLLVSLPSMQGDYFSHSVTLLIEHNEDGAFGLVINKPIDGELSDLLEGDDPLKGQHVALLESGPVERNRMFFLHSSDRTYESSLAINDDVTLTTSLDLIDAVASLSGPQHIFAGLGYAGWSGGQLEDEIRRDVWLVTPFGRDIMFDIPFEDRPEAAARSIGIDLNLISPTPGHG